MPTDIQVTTPARGAATGSPFPPFDTSYARLPGVLFSKVTPYGATRPTLLKVNGPLARHLGFRLEALDEDEIAAIFSGNRLAEGSQPIALAYAGHQFGGFNPGLGDGRALLLGETVAGDGRRYDIQLKGSGQTPYSRQGDGRAALGPVLREYVMSEAMAALGVPTTRALAAVATGDRVLRDGILPGAMVTRVAASHLRVGTFELASLHRDRAVLAALTAYARHRHYGAATAEGHDGNDALVLLHGVIAAQAALIAHWMSIGFIHGVMNTDNCAISGETIDYGPCAFMDAMNADQVYSSIDHQGRYAYSNQPPIAHWNMAVLAQALLPVIDEDEGRAVALAQAAVDGFPDLFQAAYGQRMRAKLGLSRAEEGDARLIGDLLAIMQAQQADFTGTFRALCDAQTDPAALIGHLGDAGHDWLARWRRRLEREQTPVETRRSAMRQANPAIIARNHRIEAMIASALAGDLAPFHGIVEALANPFADPPAKGEGAQLALPPAPHEVVRATFCGT